MTCPTHGTECPGHLHWEALEEAAAQIPRGHEHRRALPIVHYVPPEPKRTPSAHFTLEADGALTDNTVGHYGANFGGRGHGKVYAQRAAEIARARATFTPEFPVYADGNGGELFHPSDMRRFHAHLQEEGITMQSQSFPSGEPPTFEEFAAERLTTRRAPLMFVPQTEPRFSGMTAEERQKARKKNKAARQARKGKR